MPGHYPWVAMICAARDGEEIGGMEHREDNQQQEEQNMTRARQGNEKRIGLFDFGGVCLSGTVPYIETGGFHHLCISGSKTSNR
jgi:hypothetical protein